MSNAAIHTQQLKQFARQLGFDHCGIATARKLDADARRLEGWLKKGMQGKMHYMENHFELRIDPTKLVPGARSVITLLFNYFPSQSQQPDRPKVSRYAYGKDYHQVIRHKLNAFLGLIKEHIGMVAGRGFVDSAPVLERSWAVRSGLGWVGKNGNLITKKGGSYFFIATLVTDVELVADDPFMSDFCGSCTRCIDACPTNAILPEKVVDGSKCISYFTIELKDKLIPEAYKGRFENWFFGCDTCQEVCPWNRFSQPHEHVELTPIPELLNMSTAEWESLTETRFRELFSESPMQRTKYEGIVRNLKFLKE